MSQHVFFDTEDQGTHFIGERKWSGRCWSAKGRRSRLQRDIQAIDLKLANPVMLGSERTRLERRKNEMQAQVERLQRVIDDGEAIVVEARP